jgi:hypothetical protein
MILFPCVTVRNPNPADFSQSRFDTRVWRFARRANQAAKPPGQSKIAAKRANCGNFAVLDLSRDCWRLGSCDIFTRSCMQQFRIQTLLISHNPVSTRARHAAEGGGLREAE